jgi:hypothetical protein
MMEDHDYEVGCTTWIETYGPDPERKTITDSRRGYNEETWNRLAMGWPVAEAVEGVCGPLPGMYVLARAVELIAINELDEVPEGWWELVAAAEHFTTRYGESWTPSRQANDT